MSGQSVARKIELLDGKVFTTCRTCGNRFRIERPWSIDVEGRVVVPRSFATISNGKRAVKEEVDVFRCAACFEEHARKLVTPREVPPAPVKPTRWHCDSHRGKLHGIGDTAKQAYESMPKDKRQILSEKIFIEHAEICKE